MFSKSRSKSVWLLPIFLLIIDLTKTNLSSNIFSLDSASCNDIVIVLKSSKESVGRKSRDSGGLVKPTFPSKSYNLILVTMHFCVTCRLCKWVQIITFCLKISNCLRKFKVSEHKAKFWIWIFDPFRLCRPRFFDQNWTFYSFWTEMLVWNSVIEYLSFKLIRLIHRISEITKLWKILSNQSCQ